MKQESKAKYNVVSPQELKGKKIYISGPMSGLTKKAYTRNFDRAAQRLRKRGVVPVNPVRLPWARWDWLYRMLGYKTALMLDIAVIAIWCDGVLMIDGWDRSKGAKAEAAFAYAALDVYTFCDNVILKYVIF